MRMIPTFLKKAIKKKIVFSLNYIVK